ncbi:hypothetical protein [Streptomyces europaeiscabiei]|uniref:hypothetical protein n=1 Tax=Streptomyces europaeiscabiei TaxID=146819 RepID=UPI0029ACE392|nr:hypothetical protein [Streptomyces europaeiscabiei]MDX2762850.1 hypothetical protein [Streptomyces europaeiscabiei]
MEDDDSTIPNEELLLRWVPAFNPALLVRDSDTNEVIGPSSAAFAPDTDGASVYLDSLVQANSLEPPDVTHAPTDSVWTLPVGQVRELNLGVRRDPWPQDVDDPEHPRYAAHALITGLLGLSKKQRIRAQKGLARSTSLKCVFMPPDPS